MTRRSSQFLALMTIAALTFGCRNVEEKTATGAGTPTELSTNSDTSVTTTGSTGGGASALSPSDKEFVMTAAQANLADVQLGLLTGRNTTNADVRAFGQMMAQDHTRTMEELRQLVLVKGLVLPSEPANEHVQLARDLVTKTGRDFYQSYLAAMVAAHEKSVASFDQASRTSSDPDVKAFAASKLPGLQEHLRMAQDAQRKLK